MSTEVEAPPSSTEQDVTPQAPAPVGTDAAATEVKVDFDRVLAGDEAYTAEINEKLRGDAPAEAPKDEAKEQDAGKPVPEKPAEPAEPAEDNTLIFRGKQIPIPEDRKKQKDLMQKGMSLDTRLRELSPLIALEREIPDLMKLAATPEGRKQIQDRIRAEEKQAAKDDLPEVDGYDKSDVAAVDKILQARMKALGIVPKRDSDPTPEQIKAAEADRADLEKETKLTLNVMRRSDREFDGKWETLQAILAKAERDLSQSQFADLRNKINDPRILHPETGEPVFIHFWENVVTPEFNKSRQTQPAVPTLPTGSRRAPAPSGRMAPGSATAPSIPAPAKDWNSMPKDEFEKAFNEALSRG